MSQNIDFDRLKYSLTGEYEEVVLEKQLKEKETQQKEFIKYLEKVSFVAKKRRLSLVSSKNEKVCYNAIRQQGG